MSQQRDSRSDRQKKHRMQVALDTTPRRYPAVTRGSKGAKVASPPRAMRAYKVTASYALSLSTIAWTEVGRKRSPPLNADGIGTLGPLPYASPCPSDILS